MKILGSISLLGNWDMRHKGWPVTLKGHQTEVSWESVYIFVFVLQLHCPHIVKHSAAFCCCCLTVTLPSSQSGIPINLLSSLWQLHHILCVSKNTHDKPSHAFDSVRMSDISCGVGLVSLLKLPLAAKVKKDILFFVCCFYLVLWLWNLLCSCTTWQIMMFS